jgi:mRNA interferase MazF
MRRGDVVWVDFEPVRGNQANKRRPAVIVSNDGANRTAQSLGRGVITVVPVTSNTDRVYAFQVVLPAKSSGLRKTSKAQAEQVRSISAQRVTGTVGHLTPELIGQLDEALRLHLNV